MQAICNNFTGELEKLERETVKLHYPWWGYVKHIVRGYIQKFEIEVGTVEWLDHEAVYSAIESTKCMEDGDKRLEVIRLLHWDRTHTLEGAAYAVPCSRATAYRWQREFFEEVAMNRKLLDRKS